jgi:glutathione peroxidase
LTADIYQFEIEKSDGSKVLMEQYKGKVLLIVNTASKCGFTPQYNDLNQVYDELKDQGFEVLAFPCNQFGGQEPGDNQAIQEFCQINFQTSFPVFSKLDVKGANAHPLFKYLSTELPGLMGSKNIKWNFTKFLIDKNGQPVKRYPPQTTPQKIKVDIVKLLS